MGILIELVINTFELAVPVGACLLYLASIRVEMEREEKAADQQGLAKSHHDWFGYWRGEQRYAHRFLAGLLGLTICAPLAVVAVWLMLRVFA